MPARILILTLASTLLAACGDDKNTTEGSSDTGVTSGGLTDATVGMSSDPTTTGSADGSADGTAGTTVDDVTTTTTTGPEPTGGPTTDEPETTTGPIDPEVVMGCMQMCSNAVECMVMRDVEECTRQCSEGLGDAQGQCKKATGEFLDCVAEMDCAELTALFVEEEPGMCAAQQAALEEECSGGDVCGVSIGGNEAQTECSMEIDCEGQLLRRIECDTLECTCFEGERIFGMCPADGACMTDIAEKGAECCGF